VAAPQEQEFTFSGVVGSLLLIYGANVWQNPWPNEQLEVGPPRAFGDQVDRSNQQTSSSGKVKRTGEHFSWYGSDNLRANIEQPSCRQYKPGDFLAIRPLNWNEIIDEDDDDENWADPGASSSGWSRPSHDTHNDDGEGEEDMQGGEKGTGKGKGTKNGKGKGKGKGKGNGKGKGIVKLYEADLDTEG